MVRIPGSDFEWQQHTHNSGRAFLSNPTTNETRWLWTKWDINGRLFVRNTIDPSMRIWYDDMDLAMRIESGVATADDILKFRGRNRSPSTETVVVNAAPIEAHIYNAHGRPAPHTKGPFSQGSFINSNVSSSPHLPPAAISHGLGASHFRTGSVRNSRFSHPMSQQQDSQSSLLTKPIKPPFFLNTRVPGRTASNTQRLGQPSLPYNSHSNVHSRTPYQNRSFANNMAMSLPSKPDDYPDPFVACPNSRTEAERHELGVEATSNNIRIEKSSNDDHGLSRFAHSFLPSNRDTSDNFSNLSNSLFFSNRDCAYNGTKRPRLAKAPAANTLDHLSSPIRKKISLSRAARRLHVIGYATAPIVASIHSRSHHELKFSSRGSFSAIAGDEDESCAFEPVVGMNNNIEKDYLRLTSAPKPSAVRPPSVLRESLAHIKTCWMDGRRGYDWVCRQLKSVRQDYKVQAIRNADVVETYETHARIALENGDLGEFNTCVAQVHDLYAILPDSAASADEFTGYRILYNVITDAKAWEQLRVVARLLPKERSRPATRFALDVRCAFSTGNYHRYFYLAATPPRGTMISYLLTRLDDRMRYRALCSMITAYAPGQPGLLPLRFVFRELGCAPPCKANSQSEDKSTNISESFVENENPDLRDALRQTGLLHEPLWVLRCVSLLLRFNVIFSSKEHSDVKYPIDAVYMDCKATKLAGGIRKLDATRELITHAGSAFHR